MKFSRDEAISRIPAPHLLKQGQLQLADASFRDNSYRAKQIMTVANMILPQTRLDFHAWKIANIVLCPSLS